VTALPPGFEVVLDRRTRQLDDSTLFGAGSGRLVRLSTSGRAALAELRSGPVRSARGGQLGRRLIDAGLAHPRPPRDAGPADVTVIIPVRDRPSGLAACLASLGSARAVVVVDDASEDPSAIAAVCAEHGASLIRRDANGGPGVARNTGLDEVSTQLVAFVDSDCVPGPDWIDLLTPHFADPSVAAVAPRIVGTDGDTPLGRYTAACGALDLGTSPANVAPSTKVAYVPTAALLVRRDALLDVAVDGAVFDPELRVGEDVDLVWRLHSSGWRVRYDPSVEVPHREPATWRELLARRHRYGASAAQLGRRHPDFIAPVVVHPWAAVAAVGLLDRRPMLAGIGLTLSALRIGRRIRRLGLPRAEVARAAAGTAGQAGSAIGRYATQVAGPALVATALVSPRRRAAAAALLLGPPLASWLTLRPRLDPARFAIARIADEIAYGSGVLVGSVAARTPVAIRPKFIHDLAI